MQGRDLWVPGGGSIWSLSEVSVVGFASPFLQLTGSTVISLYQSHMETINYFSSRTSWPTSSPVNHYIRPRTYWLPKGVHLICSLPSPLVSYGLTEMRERVVGWGPEVEKSLLTDERELCSKTSRSPGSFFESATKGILIYYSMLFSCFSCGLVIWSPKCVHFMLLVKEYSIQLAFQYSSSERTNEGQWP